MHMFTTLKNIKLHFLVVAGLLHLWLNFVTFMVSHVITVMIKNVLHLWLVMLLHLWLVVITFMGDTDLGAFSF